MSWTNYPITPIAKPRMTRRDKWQTPPRECVRQYRDFCDLCRLHKVQLEADGCHVTFVLPMPSSWSEKKKKGMDGKSHCLKPDLDNLLKALSDAVYENDQVIWDVRATKLWGRQGMIRIDVREI